MENVQTPVDCDKATDFFVNSGEYISLNLCNNIVISCLFVVYSKLFPRGAVNDLMHYCTRPSTIVHQVVHGTEG